MSGQTVGTSMTTIFGKQLPLQNREDFLDQGELLANSRTAVIITSGASKEYDITKSKVKGFNGVDVSLKVTIGIRMVQTLPTVKVI